MKINSAGLAIIKHYEGCRLEAYKCPRGVLTIGYGHTGSSVKAGDKITQHQADVVLEYDLERFEQGVEALVSGLSENQFSALVSFAFNEGLGALGRSALLKKVKQADLDGAAEQFGKWVYIDGQVFKGLVSRREAEKALFLTP